MFSGSHLLLLPPPYKFTHTFSLVSTHDMRAFTLVLLNFLSILHEKNLLFLFYTSIFTNHLHQFIYFTHLFIKIFIILLIFIIHSLPAPLSHKLTATITTQPPSPPSSETKQKSDQATHTDQPTRKIIRNQRKIRSTHTKNHQKPIGFYRSTQTKNQIQHQINPHKEKSTPIKTPSPPQCRKDNHPL